jgi:hypothetical protein
VRRRRELLGERLFRSWVGEADVRARAVGLGALARRVREEGASWGVADLAAVYLPLGVFRRMQNQNFV